MVFVAGSAAAKAGLVPTLTIGVAQGSLGGDMIAVAANAAAAAKSMVPAAMRGRRRPRHIGGVVFRVEGSVVFIMSFPLLSRLQRKSFRKFCRRRLRLLPIWMQRRAFVLSIVLQF